MYVIMLKISPRVKKKIEEYSLTIFSNPMIRFDQVIFYI